ncbi:DUF1214 domain-containing protein [Novosphingobium lentum]|uniref:DUF1214 domain-containing protein n=1 Tax=Novosphingobium lentum TaxID=145287 RepID=UPI0008318D14|nr:DUF1214 domain-containing protein [Novosphingobium lentum]
MTDSTNADGETVLAKAWQRFHAAQTEVLGWMTTSPRYAEWPQHRAKAYHTMMEALAMAYNFAVAPRMANPRVQVNTGWFSDFYTLGQNGPDLFYAVMFLDGAQEYRLTGNMGESPLVLFQLLNHLSGHPDSRAISNHDFADFKIGADGSYDIALSAREQPGNWIALDPACDRHFVLVRRFMGHPGDRPATMHLARTSEIAPDHYAADEFDPVAVARRIDTATDFLKYLIKDFNMGLFDFYSGVGGGYNNMAFLPGTITSQVGSPTSNYAMAVFNLAEDEALVITLDPLPDGVYWSFQLGDVWSRSLDFGARQTSLAMSQIKVDADGACRVVVAHRDPGIANWLDTCRRHQGTVVFRNYKATGQPVPDTRLVKLADLAAALPADTALVTTEERAATLDKRRRAYIQLHGE